MPTLLRTKTKINTKTAVALIAGTVILAAGIAGGVGLRNNARGGFSSTQAYIPSVGTYLDVRFISKGSVKVNPEDTSVNMGIYRVKAVRGDVTVSDFNVSMLVQDVISSSVYTIGVDGSVEADDHLTNCLLRNTATNTTMMGPVSPPAGNGMSSTQLLFTDDITIAMGQTVDLRLECDFTSLPPNGVSDQFAVNLMSTTHVTAVEPMPSLAPVPVVFPTTNGNPLKYYVILQ